MRVLPIDREICSRSHVPGDSVAVLTCQPERAEQVSAIRFVGGQIPPTISAGPTRAWQQIRRTIRFVGGQIPRTIGALALALLLSVLLSSSVFAGSPFVIQENEKDYITILEGSKPVFRYIRGEIVPNGAPEDRRRSTYVDPVYSLDGKPVSEDGPKDHWHHRGLSWMWPKVTFDGITKDLWNLRGIRQHYVKHEAQALPDSAVLKATNFWDEDSTKRKIMDEVVTLTAYRADSIGRIIDFEVQLSARDVPVSIGTSARGYGGLQIRFGPRKETIITTSKGVISKDVDRERFTWADLSAKFNGSDEFDGIAIFDNKRNPHFPTGWTLRPYGVLDPAFTSTSEDYTIEPGKPLTLRYRVYVHRGKADPAVLHRMFDEYYRGE